jgi:hypothetical protein
VKSRVELSNHAKAASAAWEYKLVQTRCSTLTKMLPAFKKTMGVIFKMSVNNLELSGNKFKLSGNFFERWAGIYSISADGVFSSLSFFFLDGCHVERVMLAIPQNLPDKLYLGQEEFS